MTDEWFNSFDRFLADVGPRPSRDNTLDRIDNNGPYAPGNVRWATYFEQGNNKRNNFRIEHDGETRTLSDWSQITGVPRDRIRARLEKLGWTPAQALGFEERRRPAPTVTQREGLARGSGHNRLFVTMGAETKPLREWCAEFGVKRTTVQERVRRGMTYEEAFSHPVAT